MKLLTLTLALAPLRAHANGRLARYARNSTSHPGRCDRNVVKNCRVRFVHPTHWLISTQVMADKIKDWIEQLVTIPRVFKHTKGRGFKHKIPDDVSFVYCQLEACVIGKRNRHVEGSRPGLPGHDFPGRR